jgi:hypothetical protein
MGFIHEYPLPLSYGRAACALPLGAYGHFNMGTPRMPNVTPAVRILPAPYFDKDAKRLRRLYGERGGEVNRDLSYVLLYTSVL